MTAHPFPGDEVKHEQVDIEKLRAEIAEVVRLEQNDGHVIPTVAINMLAALDELAALREQTRWRDISTFDLDDDHVALLLIDGSPYMGACFDGEFFIEGDFSELFRPSHWRPIGPLPTPPPTEGEAR